MIGESPLVDASADQLDAAIEENLFALFRAMATLPGSEIVETEKLSYHLASPSNPMFKGVWRARLAPDEIDDAIDETLAWFKARAAPFLFWWTGPSTEPTQLGERLAARGLRSMAEQTREMASGLAASAVGMPGMVADLTQVTEATLAQAPPGFAIEEVQSEAALADLKRVVIASYGLPDAMAQGWVDAALAWGWERVPWTLYLARLQGEPVATALRFDGAGVMGIYAVGTVPEGRGKGIGGAITLKALLDGRERGYRYAVLSSSLMGVHAYERIGFRTSGVWLNRHLWRAT